MEATLGELRAFLEQVGMRPRLRGDSSRVIRRVATLEDAGDGDVSFLSNPKYEKMLQTTRASAIVLKPDVAAPEQLDLLQVDDPYAALQLLAMLRNRNSAKG